MKKLIISLDTYSWFRYCSGMIMRVGDDFSIIIIHSDDKKDIYGCCNPLCSEAIYAQRSDDLFRLGKGLGIKKVMNFRFDEDGLDLKKLVAMLQLEIMLGRYDEVIFQYSDSMLKIFEEFRRNLKIKSFYYGDVPLGKMKNSISFKLNRIEFRKKQKLISECFGIHSLEEIIVSNEEKIFVI